MKIIEVTPKGPGAILPGADFSDSWRATGLSVRDTAEDIARRLPRAAPGWVSGLLALRNLLVAPFGLKTDVAVRPNPNAPMFPVIASRPERVVLGMDDKHLNFRLVVDMEAPTRETRAATVTTYVRTNNRGGRLYLALILPFHRIIVPVLLRRAVQGGA